MIKGLGIQVFLMYREHVSNDSDNIFEFAVLSKYGFSNWVLSFLHCGFFVFDLGGAAFSGSQYAFAVLVDDAVKWISHRRSAVGFHRLRIRAFVVGTIGPSSLVLR